MFSSARLWVVLAFVFASFQASADKIRMYTRGDKSLAAHLEALQGAQHSILLHTFEFKPCETSGKLIIALLAQKASQGLDVRVLLDAYMLKDFEKKGLAWYFKAMNIKFRLYNNSFSIFQNHRSHIKLIVIDGETNNGTFFADSSNLGDEYFGMSVAKNFVNRDFRITGRSARQARAGFEMLWASYATSTPRDRREDGFFDKCLATTARDQQIGKYIRDNASDLVAAKAVTCSNITYQIDDPNFQSSRHEDQDRDNRNDEYMNDMRLKKKRSTLGVLEFISGAGHVLNVENQYYMPSDRLKRALKDLRDKKNIPIFVLTGRSADGVGNTGEQISHFTMKAAARDTRGSMAVLAISSYGSLAKRNPLTPKRAARWHLHSKSMVRDHQDVWMGSFNFDPRSYHTNLEYGVVVTGCPGLANAIERDYQRMIEGYKKDFSSCRECQNDFPNLDPLEVIGAFFTQNFL